MKEQSLTYADAGVDYSSMDPFKRLAQLAGRDTAEIIKRLGFKEFEPSRGESAYLIDTGDNFLAHVEEGLGTKCLVTDAMYQSTGTLHYDKIAQDTVAMIVNDMITVGALPLSVAMHLAVGDSSWFKDERRAANLIRGWEHACTLARCSWGGGETPTLGGIVIPGTIILSGSAVGVVKPRGRLIRGNIEHGDAIIFIESSGIHANGLSLARQIAGKLPKKYLTPLLDGKTYGATLLEPTLIYVPLVEGLLGSLVPIHYAVHITGHGWRKLMRAQGNFSYIINALPKQLPIFDFIQKHAGVDDREMYGTFNMGAGFALYIPEGSVSAVFEFAKISGFRAFRAGRVEWSGAKRVVIEPKDLVYEANTLAVR